MLAITQAICLYRRREGIDGPLFIGIDTHALSRAGVRERARGAGRQRRRSHGSPKAANTRRRRRSRTRFSSTTADARTALADGIVVTPSHNPPDNGGFKYNPPNGGPADTDVTGWIEAKANALLEGGLKDVRRIPFEQARRAATTREHDFLSAYVGDLGNVIDFDAIRGVRHPHGRRSAGRRRRPLLGADRRALPARPDRRQRGGRSDIRLHDPGLGRPHPHGSVLGLRDAAADRPQGSLRHRVRLRHRSRSPRHRDAERGPDAAESLSRGGDRLPVPESAALERRTRPSARPWSAAR